MKNLPQGYELQEAYPLVCAACGHEQQASPSIIMEMGLNSGHGNCLKCEQFLHLEIELEKGVIVSQKWEDYLPTIQAAVSQQANIRAEE